MKIEITKEQFSALEMLSKIGDYYLDDMEPSNPSYESDRDSVTTAQDVLQQIEQQILKGNSMKDKIIDGIIVIVFGILLGYGLAEWWC